MKPRSLHERELLDEVLVPGDEGSPALVEVFAVDGSVSHIVELQGQNNV